MPDFDAFNGDADGICALHQLRLAEPREATLITGVKRDIALLRRIDAGRGDRVTALDISLNKNREPLLRLLDAGASVEYFDHHQADDIPAHPNLHAHIDTGAEWCTSLLVNRQLGGRHLIWAVVAAVGVSLTAGSVAEAGGGHHGHGHHGHHGHWHGHRGYSFSGAHGHDQGRLRCIMSLARS